jgi:hypothetical protein
MLEIRKNTFSKSYENSFFREFSRHLYNSFKEKNLSGVLIGSPVCKADERLQMDTLLVTPNVVCIIDFKNFKGKIKLPHERNFEFGLWTTDEGEQVKGGSASNPFIQLKNQKRRFIEVSNKHILNSIERPDTFNPYHLIRIVCFQEEVAIEGQIPAKEALNFFILNKTNFIEQILDIVDVTDKEVNLSERSFNTFKDVFRANQYKFDERPLENEPKETPVETSQLEPGQLYNDQKAALREINAFFEDPDQQVFILQGTCNSGKTFLIPYIQELAYNSGIHEAEIFVSSRKVSHNLLSANRIEANSIYSYIYGGNKVEPKDNETASDEMQDENEATVIKDDLPLEIVPLKNCDNAENALFIVDESQLISDAYHQSIDMVFGTGCLLKDFLGFADLNASERKIIFIGDPYQLQLGRTDESPLNPAYLETIYGLKVLKFQLLDKLEFSAITQQALHCVQQIKEKIFNSLHFDAGSHIAILAREDYLSAVTRLVEDNTDAHILSFNNEEALKINLWVKKSILRTGEDIAPRDLVLFNNNIAVEDNKDPFAEPKKISNGQFATVLAVGENIFPETVNLKGQQITINFREVTLLLKESGHQVNVLSLENFRLNSKAELSREELIAYKVILNTELNRFLNKNPFEFSPEYRELISSAAYINIEKEIELLKKLLANGEKVKGKLQEKEVEQRKMSKLAKRKYKKRVETTLRNDSTSKYYRYKNAALLRFGWALTVHRSMSYKWDEVIFNVDPGANTGRTNESHYRWLYTGISRAKKKLSLINYKPISPFDKTVIRDQNTATKPEGIFFRSENADTAIRLKELRELVTARLSAHALTVRNVEPFNWQERYFINNGDNNEAVISFSYNGQGVFKLPVILGSNNEVTRKVIDILRSKTELTSFEGIRDLWRRSVYEKIRKHLAPFDIKFELIQQTNFKDKLRFFSANDELEIELDYSGDGMISFITAKYYNEAIIWNKFQEAILTIKNS